MTRAHEAPARLPSSDRDPRRGRRSLAWIAVAMLAVGLQILVKGPQGLWWSAVFDAGHAPLFGLIALAFLGVAPSLWPGSARSPVRRYGLAFVLAVFVGGVTETAQILGSRDADPGDLARNVLGAAAFLLARFAWERRAQRGPRNVAALVGAALLLFALWPVMTLAAAFVQRDAAFPRICDFEHRWERKFLRPCHAQIAFVAAPGAWNREDTGDLVAEVTLRPARFPGFEIVEPYPVWQDHDRLLFEIFSEADSVISLAVRINDDLHNQEYRDRFNRELSIHPGQNQISIALSDVERGPRERRMNMAAIRNLTFFAVDLSNPLTFYVDAVRVE